MTEGGRTDTHTSGADHATFSPDPGVILMEDLPS